MTTLAELTGLTPEQTALRLAFLRWQCRTRQIAMRDHDGRPDAAITPEVTPVGAAEPLGHVITVFCKSPAYSKTMELRHMVRKTNDPAQRREAALTYFRETYYQKPQEFSDILTATFQPGSKGAAAMRAAKRCTLSFDHYKQRFDVECRVWMLAKRNPLHQSTYWHNLLFNPNLPADTVILGFEPDWSKSSADPAPKPV